MPFPNPPLPSKTNHEIIRRLNIQSPFFWHGRQPPRLLDQESLAAMLQDFSQNVVLLEKDGQFYISSDPSLSTGASEWKVIGYSAPFLPADFGAPSFLECFSLKYPLYGGAMANGISSVELVTTLGRAGFMGTFGAGGLLPGAVEAAILKLKDTLDGKPYAFNLLNSPLEPALEEQTVALYLKHEVRVIEASAYLNVTRNLAHYRAAGLSLNEDGSIAIANRIIAKVSRKEVAVKFLEPVSQDMLNHLFEEGKITAEQVRLALLVPVADAITVEADSGGHTDNRPLVGVLPAIIRLRNQVQARRNYAEPVHIGAAGGIATPESVLAAFMMGAAYVVTGSINQACVESGASELTRKLLGQAEMTDVAMAPASDMFEMGVRVQVLKRGTMFAMRAQKLFELYSRYESLEDIPAQEREKLESTIFKMGLDDVWNECLKFFTSRDPGQIERARQNPKSKMALVFRWYLGLSSRWSTKGEPGREMDYQVWCGPAMGAFNDWTRGSYLESAENRKVADVSLKILEGAAYLYRLQILESQGVRFADVVRQYCPGAQ
ncbi:MAG: PfaD family polyunsaturated fatty acid/polyketide biosynthesis protein [Anaerolineaceae bacterium]